MKMTVGLCVLLVGTLLFIFSVAEVAAQARRVTPPVKQVASQPVTTAQGIQPINSTKKRLLQKLNSIVIPQLDFRQANILDVLRYLDQQTIIADKASPPGEKGVHLILQLNRRGAASQANIPTVTLSLRNIVLLNAIKFITEVTGLKYRIEENVVVITPDYQKLADQGDAESQYNLGLCYENGGGMPKDSTKAFEWYQKAAALGLADAQVAIGTCYATGEGVPKNGAKAVEWYRKAADQGHAKAREALTRLLPR